MKLKNINWNKKLLVFFGDDVKNLCGDIKLNADSVKSFTDCFPEHTLYHPWEHVDHLEHITKLISRADDRKFTIVTNSSYILDHLTNLMKGVRVNADEKYTRCKSKSAYIHKKEVGVYVCTGGKIKDALPKKGEIIEWGNLSEVSEWLSDVYFEMGEFVKVESAGICSYCHKPMVKHIIKEGARYHVHSWDSKGMRCSEPDCEDNHIGGRCSR